MVKIVMVDPTMVTIANRLVDLPASTIEDPKEVEEGLSKKVCVHLPVTATTASIDSNILLFPVLQEQTLKIMTWERTPMTMTTPTLAATLTARAAAATATIKTN